MKKWLGIILILCLFAVGFPALAEENVGYAAGSNHSGFITAKGNLYMVGWNRYGQVGLAPREEGRGDSVYALTRATLSVTQVSLGFWHSLSLNAHGNVFAWGRNEFGQVGNGLADGLDVTTPTYLPQLRHIVQIAAGDESSFALDKSGTVWAWGRNARGQLALGNMKHQYVPTPVPNFGNVAHIFAGERNSAFLLQDGSFWMAGENTKGQLCLDWSVDYASSPVMMGLQNVVTMDIGDFHVAAVTVEGDLYMWGDNAYGQLGMGDAAVGQSFNTPQLIMTGVRSVALGDYQSFVITNDNSLYAFGRNDFGQLGVGDKEQRNAPVQVLSDVLSVRSGFAFAIAKTLRGDYLGWGKGDLGQLCPGAKSVNLTPIVIKAYK
jgi:alpha-tubulin suppressor-like RCC1 family protein